MRPLNSLCILYFFVLFSSLVLGSFRKAPWSRRKTLQSNKTFLKCEREIKIQRQKETESEEKASRVIIVPSWLGLILSDFLKHSHSCDSAASLCGGQGKYYCFHCTEEAVELRAGATAWPLVGHSEVRVRPRHNSVPAWGAGGVGT